MALPASRESQKSSPPKTKESIWRLLGKIPGGKFFWVFLLLVAMGLGGWLIFGDKGLYHLYTLRRERDRLQQENLVLKDEIDRMVKMIDRLRNDQDYIEDIIRRDLRFIKKNEIIYQLAPEVGSGPRVTQAPALGPPPSPAAKAKRANRP
jgi:cell division protein FtsB